MVVIREICWHMDLLNAWRAVSRHLEAADVLADLAPLLHASLPHGGLVLRRADVARGEVLTIAASPGRVAELPRRSPVTASLGEDLVAWAGRGEVVWLRPGDRHVAVAGLPLGLHGEVIVAGLGEGALVVLAPPPSGRLDAHAEVRFAPLLELLATAASNDRRLHELVRRKDAVEADNQALLQRLDRQDISEAVVGAETGLREVMAQVDQVGPTDVPVLILGETGSGKEVIARALHQRSHRARGPLLRVNCGAISPDLVDSELFGHEKGSFTGATATRTGWFERADGGTLFLDEVGELSAAAQVRLLRVLQDGVLQRVGGEKPVQVDVRVVAATHRDLEAMVAVGGFRQDLWYRLSVFPVRLPPLRARKHDIPALAAWFAAKAGRRLGASALAPDARDIGLLVAYDWPGNVRELSAVIERAAILGGGRRLEVAAALGMNATAPAPSPQVPDPTRFPDLDEANRRHIEAALTRCDGTIEGPYGAAVLLNINPHTLRARMRKLGITPNQFRRRPWGP
jgi:hydrogenase-4 transcriptional activator